MSQRGKPKRHKYAIVLRGRGGFAVKMSRPAAELLAFNLKEPSYVQDCKTGEVVPCNETQSILRETARREHIT